MKQLLRERGERHQVTALFEYLGWGPIDCSLADRAEWFETHVPDEDGWDWFTESVEESRSALARASEPIIWVAPRNAAEMSALHWYLRQFGGAGARMVIADQPLEGGWAGEPPLSLGELNHEQLAQLLARPLESWDERRFPVARWDELVADHALLRIVKDGRLQSASPDEFDEIVLQSAPAGWTRWSRIMGNAMAELMNRGHAVDEMFLRWRLRELVAAGSLELDGDLAVRGTGDAVAKLRRI